MSRPKFDEGEIKKFKKLLDTGMSRAEVARKLGYSKSLVARNTAGYKPKIGARAKLREATKKKYKKIAAMCMNSDMVSVSEKLGEQYNTVTKACRMFPELCTKKDKKVSLNPDFISDVKKLLRRGLDEYEIISALHHRYVYIKKSDVQAVRRNLPEPRIGFCGMMV